MKIESYKFPKASFLAREKDLELIVDLILKNERLKKLLYYTSPDCLDRPNVPQDKALELFNKNIKLVPKLLIDQDVLNYILINFDVFTPSGNPEFRDNMIEFDIICHFNQWQLKDFGLRPYKIAAEIDTMIQEKKLTGLGDIEFVGANQMVLTDEFAGLCLMYQTVHGTEDQKDALNPKENIDLINNFNKIFNE